MRGAGSKPPAAPSLETSFCSWGLRLLLRLSASSASAATSRGARRRVAPRRAARRTRRVGLRRTAASACVFARQFWLLRLRLLPFGLPRPRLSLTARRTRRGGRRDGRAASGSAARPCRHVTAPLPIGRLLLDFNISSSSLLSASSASAATTRGAADAPRRAGLMTRAMRGDDVRMRMRDARRALRASRAA